MPTAALTGRAFPLRGPLRPAGRLSRFWTLFRDLTRRPLTGRLLTGRPLTGRLLTGDAFNYRKAYGKLRGGTFSELGGNFRRFMARPPRARPQSHIKASAQKPRSANCMHRLMPCLRRPLRADRLRGGLPLTRALTARPLVEPFLDPFKGPYGKAPYG